MVEKVLQVNRERTIFWTLIGVLAISAVFYIYCVNATVHNVVSRQNLEAKASELSLKISNEEFQYITKRNEITLATAYQMGFKDAQVKSYIPENPSTAVAFAGQ